MATEDTTRYFINPFAPDFLPLDESGLALARAGELFALEEEKSFDAAKTAYESALLVQQSRRSAIAEMEVSQLDSGTKKLADQAMDLNRTT